MAKFKDLTGTIFGRLTVINWVTVTPYPKRRWRCLCSCGKACTVKQENLRQGHTRSCGCLREETRPFNSRTHGHSRGYKLTKEYRAWRSMRDRCNRPGNKHYANYGGRGITVCERWQHSFENFLTDIGTAPNAKLTLDRINNNEGYSPDNCRWTTRYQQRMNQRPRRYQ